MTCAVCHEKVPPNVRNCPSCQADVGFPNVRATQTTKEINALKKRVEDSSVSTGLRGCKSVLDRFERTVLKSEAVFCQSLDLVLDLVSRENKLYISFHKQVAAGLRLPKDDAWEIGRPAVESTLFPHYHEEINFTCLTLNGTGLTNYGAYSIVLKDRMISLRSSVFEENPFLFMEKHRIVAGHSIPPGYRASWNDRGLLARAKLHSRIDKNTTDDQFPDILMQPGASSAVDEFIEVHIFGPIHPTSFDRIVGPKPTRKHDLALWKSLQSKCKNHGIILEEK